MTAVQMISIIGKPAKLATEGFFVDVTVVDVKKVWNRIDYLITPVSGSGEKWVSSERVYGDWIQ